MIARTFGGDAGPDLALIRRNLLYLAAILALMGVAIGAAQISVRLFQVAAAALVVFFAYATLRVPRLSLLVLIFVPMVDRYFLAAMVPAASQTWVNYLSEGLLGAAGLVLAFQGWRTGRLWPALRHPAFLLLLAFSLLAVASAFVNDVPTVQATLGIVFTIDAAALFFLPRIVGFDEHQATLLVIGYVAVATIAAILALLQVYLVSDIFGLGTSLGRFSEGARVGSFMDGNPNMLGAVLAMAIPFPLFGFFRTSVLRWRILLAVVSFVLVLALFFTFSRGAWLGLTVAMLVVATVIDRRALFAIVLLGVLAYGTAHVVPRQLLAPTSQGSQLELDLQDATLGRIGAIGAGNDLRTLFIKNAIPIIEDHPIIGAGPGRYGGSVSARYGSPLWNEYRAGSVPIYRTVDNFWLHILVEAGILGTLMLLGTFFAIGWELLAAGRRAIGARRAILAACLIAGMVLTIDSVTEMLLEGNTSSFGMWLLLGLGSALVMAEQRQPAPARVEVATGTGSVPGGAESARS